MEAAYVLDHGNLRKVSLREVFSFLDTGKCVVSLVGGGGKTTLMYRLAEECRRQGKHALVTTTTHIRKPEDESVMAYTTDDLQRIWSEGKIPVAGREACNEKLTMPDRDILAQFMELADCTLIEADGAKRMPCKVPEEWEPVILPETDIVIGVVGLSALGKPLKDVCFRRERAAELLGVEEDSIITEKDLVKILASECGARKGVGDRAYYVVLNQCDDEPGKISGERMMELLAEQGIEQVVLTCFKNADVTATATFTKKSNE